VKQIKTKVNQQAGYWGKGGSETQILNPPVMWWEDVKKQRSNKLFSFEAIHTSKGVKMLK